jgi:hypothetical protein
MMKAAVDGVVAEPTDPAPGTEPEEDDFDGWRDELLK